MRRLHLHERMDIPLNSRLSLRVYADSRPHVLQTSNLQKGVILTSEGTELVGEGLGIGAPVCRYCDGTRFSLSAETFIDDTSDHRAIVKIYEMNGVAAKRFGGIPVRRRGYAARLLRLFENGYRTLHELRINTTLAIDLLSRLGMRNEYLDSHSMGQIAVTYRPDEKGLHVSANLEGLTSDELQTVVFANEQSGRLFNEYADSNGVRLQGTEIEPWRATSAEWACLYCREFKLGLKLRRPMGWRIVRGREVVQDRISWSGLDLVHDGIPDGLEYRVQFLGS